MDEGSLKTLEGYVADFSKFRANTTDGEGKSLHDLKNTFDYVINTMRNYGLSTTVFGTELETKAISANNVLSELWNNLNEIEKSITMFVENQRANNNSVEGGSIQGSSSSDFVTPGPTGRTNNTGFDAWM